jgi:hypothetical protein
MRLLANEEDTHSGKMSNAASPESSSSSDDSSGNSTILLLSTTVISNGSFLMCFFTVDRCRKKPWPPPSNELVRITDYAIPPEIDVDVLAIEFLSMDDDDDDRSFLIHYASDAEIHVALGLPGSPVVQDGANDAAASAVAFRQWVVHFFCRDWRGQ